MAGLTTRSLEGRFVRDIRRSLLEQLGDSPSPAQRMLVERCVMLSTQLARMDAKSLRDGAMSGHAVREYLSWNNALSRLLRQLGLKAAPPRAKTLAEVRAGQRAA
jgi:hypothetical protein